MGADNIIYIVLQVLCFVIALVVHEASHGFVAYKLGDPTAKRAGRLSLNPLKHIDPFGTVILPLLLIAMGWPVFGYAKPVPYNPAYFKDPRKGDFFTGIAGPLSNFALALCAAILMWILQLFGNAAFANNAVLTLVYGLFLPMFILINLYLMFFNLLPIPPLDGSSIFALLIPKKYLPHYYSIQQYAFPLFMLAMVVFPYVFKFNPFSWYLDATAGNLARFLWSL